VVLEVAGSAGSAAEEEPEVEAARGSEAVWGAWDSAAEEGPAARGWAAAGWAAGVWAAAGWAAEGWAAAAATGSEA